MATFTYDAKDSTGNSVSGIIEAAAEQGAAAALREQGLWPTRIQPMRANQFGTAPLGAPQPQPSAMGPDRIGAQSKVDAAPFLVTVPLNVLAAMYRQLATLLHAGVPMVQALTTLEEQTSNGRLKQILHECMLGVSAGNPLSSIMRRHPSVFTGIQVELILAGETAGMLETMCNRLAGYLEREMEIRRKLQQETLYPKIVLFVAGAVILLLTFLKSGSKGAIGQIEFAGEVLVGGFGLWWLSRYLNQYPRFGAAWDEFKMMIPGPGGVARKYATARFTRALGALYGGGVLLPNAVAIAARGCGNRAIGQRLLDCVGALHAGAGISGMLAQSGLLSPIAVQMAKTGEQTGSLDLMMDKVADYLESEADMRAQQLAKFAGVAALVLAAVIVGFIAVSFYGGMFAQTMHEGAGE